MSWKEKIEKLLYENFGDKARLDFLSNSVPPISVKIWIDKFSTKEPMIMDVILYRSCMDSILKHLYELLETLDPETLEYA